MLITSIVENPYATGGKRYAETTLRSQDLHQLRGALSDRNYRTHESLETVQFRSAITDELLTKHGLVQHANGKGNEIKTAMDFCQLLLGPIPSSESYGIMEMGNFNPYLTDPAIAVERLVVIDKLIPVLSAVVANPQSNPKQIFRAIQLLNRMSYEVMPIFEEFNSGLDEAQISSRGEISSHIRSAYYASIKNPNASYASRRLAVAATFYPALQWSGYTPGEKKMVASDAIDAWKLAVDHMQPGEYFSVELRDIFDNRELPNLIGGQLDNEQKFELAGKVIETVTSVIDKCPGASIGSTLLQTLMAPIEYNGFDESHKRQLLHSTIRGLIYLARRLQYDTVPQQEVSQLIHKFHEYFQFTPGEEAYRYIAPDVFKNLIPTVRGLIATLVLTRDADILWRKRIEPSVLVGLAELQGACYSQNHQETGNGLIQGTISSWRVYSIKNLVLAS